MKNANLSNQLTKANWTNVSNEKTASKGFTTIPILKMKNAMGDLVIISQVLIKLSKGTFLTM